MEKLVSSWSKTAKSLPENYVFPPGTRPGHVNVPLVENIPVIDLGKSTTNTHDRSNIVQQILVASQEFGFFQVINHGVSGDLMDETKGVFKEFFELPDEDKASVCTDDPSRVCRLYTSSYDYANEPVHYWRENLRHDPCNPLDRYIEFWPEKPTRYRDVVGRYSVEVKKLSLRILELICEGLGLDSGYFGDELTEYQVLSINHYPPCPDPSLALGLPKHSDPNLITILLQGDVYGLQVYKDEQWLGVEPIPNAFVVNIGHQLQIISNGKLKSAEHRAVTNSKDTRMSIVYFINPSLNGMVEPAKSLLNEHNPPIYRSFKYRDFLTTYRRKKGYTDGALQDFASVKE